MNWRRMLVRIPWCDLVMQTLDTYSELEIHGACRGVRAIKWSGAWRDLSWQGLEAVSRHSSGAVPHLEHNFSSPEGIH